MYLLGQPTQPPRSRHADGVRQPTGTYTISTNVHQLTDITDIGNAVVQSYQRPVISNRAVENQILDLDAFILPGLPEADFKKLFAKCHCGLIMTKRVFNIHRCMRTAASQAKQVIIDLTVDDSDESDHQ